MQFAGAYGELGVRYALTVLVGDAQALSRQASLPCFKFLGSSVLLREHVVRQACFLLHRAAAAPLSSTEVGGRALLREALVLQHNTPKVLQVCVPYVAAARQVVKSDSATVRVPELDFEIPPGTQRGTITTVEGLLREAADALRALQPERTAARPEQARHAGHTAEASKV